MNILERKIRNEAYREKYDELERKYTVDKKRIKVVIEKLNRG